MIANVSPHISACEHTMNTLRYADRVKQIKRNLTATAIAEQEHADARKVGQIALPAPAHPPTPTHSSTPPLHTHTRSHSNYASSSSRVRHYLEHIPLSTSFYLEHIPLS